MAIDGFTLVAQIVNFVLLLVLLRAFLYRPIKRVMAERERRIADEHADARRARDDAEALAAELQREREDLERHRRERMAEIEREVDVARERYAADARAEAEAARANWREALVREQEDLAEAVRLKAAGVLASALRRGWRELADEDLEERAVRSFAQRLRQLDDTTRGDLAAAVGGGGVTFTTAFEPSDEQRQLLLRAVREAVAPGSADGAGDAGATAAAVARVATTRPGIEASFERDPDLLAGVALRAGDVRVGWSARAHVEDLERAWRGESANGGEGPGGAPSAEGAQSASHP